MGKFLKKFFKTFAVLSAVTSVAGLVYSWAASSKEKQTSEKPFTVTLPNGWEDLSGQLNRQAVIEAGNKDENIFFVAIPYDSKQYNGFENYCDYLLDYLHRMYEDYTLLAREPKTVNGRPGYAVFGTLLFEGVAYRNLVYAIDFEDTYLFAMAWGPEETFKEVSPQIGAIVKSLAKRESKPAEAGAIGQ